MKLFLKKELFNVKLEFVWGNIHDKSEYEHIQYSHQKLHISLNTHLPRFNNVSQAFSDDLIFFVFFKKTMKATKMIDFKYYRHLSLFSTSHQWFI